MKRSSSRSFVAPFLFASLGLVACSSESAAPGSPVEPGAGARADGEPSAGDVDAGCTKYFDALLARGKRCSSSQSVLGLEASEFARDSFMAVCRQRSARPGTGYTPHFHETCATAFTEAGCDDYDAVVRACWMPRGALAAGSGCSTDDQCADGYCRLPSGASPGSTCGTCAVPIWGQVGSECDGKRDVTCLPGLWCGSRYAPGGGTCRRPDDSRQREGEECSSRSGTGSCADHLYCNEGVCTSKTVAPIGASCDGDELTCEAGSDCVSMGSAPATCVKNRGIGEACDPQRKAYCNGWLQCGATGKCERPQLDLNCSSSPSAPAPAADEPAKCLGDASRCSGRVAGTCEAQEGCSFVQHYRTSASGDYFESECEGTPKSCSSMPSESACLRQAGCRWE